MIPSRKTMLRAALTAVTVIASQFALPAMATQTYTLIPSAVTFDRPAPLFPTNTVSGFVVLADSVAPGANFGLAQLVDFHFNFGGFNVNFADTKATGADVTLGIATRSADGASISAFDLRYDLASTQAGCSLACAGQLEIATFDNSNFVAIDDFDANTTSLVQFNAALAQVPEPATIPLLAVAVAGLAVMSRRRRS
jgi:hypothetical protein